MTKVNNKPGTISTKARTIIFKVATVITITGMLVGGSTQFLRAGYQVDTFEQLGYPLYFMSIIGMGKILGSIALIIPRISPIFKIGAYVGLVFVTTGAVISHMVKGPAIDALSPLIVAGIAITSCLLNPVLQFVFQRHAAYHKNAGH